MNKKLFKKILKKAQQESGYVEIGSYYLWLGKDLQSEHDDHYEEALKNGQDDYSSPVIDEEKFYLEGEPNQDFSTMYKEVGYVNKDKTIELYDDLDLNFSDEVLEKSLNIYKVEIGNIYNIKVGLGESRLWQVIKIEKTSHISPIDDKSRLQCDEAILESMDQYAPRESKFINSLEKIKCVDKKPIQIAISKGEIL